MALKLKKCLESFYINNFSDTREDMIEVIRTSLKGMLEANEDFSKLNDSIQLKEGPKLKYRTIMWSILLELGKIDIKLTLRYVKMHEKISDPKKKELFDEAERIIRSMKYNNISLDDVFSVLVLYSGFLSKFDKHSYQPLICMGPFFLQYYSFPIAFYAFKQFVTIYAPRCFPPKDAKVNSEISALAVEILYFYKPSLKSELERYEPKYTVAFSHVSSFFTQMSQIDQVSILFDFILAFGAYLVIFIEAAWLHEHRDCLAVDRKNELPDATKVIKVAFHIYNEVEEKKRYDLIKKSKRLFSI